MPVSDIMTAITGGLTGAITGIGAGIGSGIKALVNSLAFDTITVGSETSTTLSVFFTLTIVFAGVTLAIGLCKRIFSWIGSLGGRK